MIGTLGRRRHFDEAKLGDRTPEESKQCLGVRSETGAPLIFERVSPWPSQKNGVFEDDTQIGYDRTKFG